MGRDGGAEMRSASRVSPGATGRFFMRFRGRNAHLNTHRSFRTSVFVGAVGVGGVGGVSLVAEVVHESDFGGVVAVGGQALD